MAPEPRARLEVPIFGPDDGPLAVSLGASRLELNRAGSYALGGTTPTLAELTTLLTSLTPTPISTSTPTSPNHTQRVPIRIMIRPRGPPPTITITTTTTTTTTPSSQNKPQNNSSQTTPQDFIYTPTEHATMASSIREFATSGLLSPALGDGFVLGVLRRSNDDDGRVVLDGERHRELVGLARGFGLRCVLHRAVDDVLSGVVAMGGEDGDGGGVEGVVVEGARGVGFDGVLTSGGRGDAVGNVGGLGEVVRVAEREGVEVIVGGGVRRGNLGGLVEGLGGGIESGLGDGVWFHSSCLRDGERFDVEEAKGLAEGLRGLGVVLSG